jgi:tripartite-type tricarboxylate transporter receptor subunit TctC
MIVAYKEGSSTDSGARLLCSYAEQYIGQPVEVRNLSSESGMTAWSTLANADPDGYTLGFINMPNIFSTIENGADYKIQDFTPICSHVLETSVVVVPESSPYQSLEELLEANRAASESGTLMRAATNGVQASNDIGAALLAYVSGGWQFQHVAYGSTADQLSSLLDGDCDWCVAKISDVAGMCTSTAETADTDGTDAAPTPEPTPTPSADKADAAQTADPNATPKPVSQRVRVLAVFDTERSPELPNVPTLDELGYPTGWYGSTRAIAAPRNTDSVIVNYYAEAFRNAMADPACVAAHQQAGFSLYYLDPQALAQRISDRDQFISVTVPKLFR